MACDSGAALFEFFAGGGFARLGLEPAFRCAFANDIDPAKARAYRTAFGDGVLKEGDVWSLSADDLPGKPALVWASSPCQDLSLAGARRGLAGARSGAFWGFWRLIEALDAEGRGPEVVAFENVCGLLTSHGGDDFNAICAAMAASGRFIGALEIDAALFVPQSRPRVFVIAARTASAMLQTHESDGFFHSKAIQEAHGRLPGPARDAWVWWRLPGPPPRNADLVALLEPEDRVRWRSPAQTQALIDQMSPRHRRALAQAGTVGAAYRRIRVENGAKVQRTEARFDGLAGCLRTPGGGSSRQFLVDGGGGTARSRLLTAREAARLMGAGDDYKLPASESAGLHLVGDAVSPPVVRWLADHLLAPLAGAAAPAQEKTPARARRG